MASQIPQYYSTMFATNIELLLQQKGSKLRKTVSEKGYTGNAAQAVDQVGLINANQVLGRYNPMGRVDAPMTSRWVYPIDFDLNQLVDDLDKLRMIVDPTSSLVESAVYALGRAMDDQIINAYFGASATGTNGATSVSFPSSQVVSVQKGASVSTGLTVAKLREARRILMANQVDFDAEEVFCIVKAKQHDNLLAEAQVVSTDFNDRPVLVDGKVVRFLGINIIHCERLGSGTDDQSGTSDAIPVYVKSGMHLGLWRDISTSTSIRHDIQNEPYQAYCKGTFGAARLQEPKVVKIWCA